MFDPNPDVEASLAFDVIQPGTYVMRVAEVREQKVSEKGNTCVPVRFEYVDPTSLTKVDGTPASNPGGLFDNGIVILPRDKQSKLRSLVEACGKAWGEVRDLNELIGCELDVKVKIGEWNGEQRNEIGRYVAK
jgi:hypothetical protein